MHSSSIRLAPKSFSVTLLDVCTGSFRRREGQCPVIIFPASLSLLTAIHGHRHTIQQVISVTAVVSNYLGLNIWIKWNYASRYVTSLSVRNCSSRSQPHSNKECSGVFRTVQWHNEVWSVALTTYFSSFTKPAVLLLYLEQLATDPRPGPERLGPHPSASFL
jgi:hypothetical protein